MTPSERHLRAVEGYLELGMIADAQAELDELERAGGEQIVMLLLRMQVLTALKKWAELAALGRDALQRFPEVGALYLMTAYGVRRAEDLSAARLILNSGEGVLAGDALFHFNMACYDCQLGDLSGARIRLEKAIDLEPACEKMALSDPDLAPLQDQPDSAP